MAMQLLQVTCVHGWGGGVAASSHLRTAGPCVGNAVAPFDLAPFS